MNVRILTFMLFLITLSSCEESITLNLDEGVEMLVVEGHIEQDAPPVVVLTRTQPLFAGLTPADKEKAFVRGARVAVTTDGKEYILREVASAAFTPELAKVVSEQFGIAPEKLKSGSDFSFHVYTTAELKGEVGKSYSLNISHEGRRLSAVTTIPHLNPIDSLWLRPHPDPKEDSLFTLFYRYRDPDTLGNSIRYFTRRNSEQFYPGTLTSVFTDELINGAAYIDFPLDRGEPRGRRIDMTTFGFFGRGDTITVRWCAIDIPHYRFWFTLEAEQNNNGSPVGTPNITQSNIKGGLGIWGGYGVTYHRIVVF